MTEGTNHKELKLLRDVPHQLILEYQSLIDIVIKQFIRSGSFSFQEFDEIKQQVNEELFRRLPKIQAQYRGESLLKTYFSVIIRNICNELIRKRVTTQFISLHGINIEQSSDEVMTSILIKEEIIKLKAAMNFYCEKKAKLVLCLKVKFRMPFDFKDFKDTFPQITIEDFESFKLKTHPYHEKPEIVLLSVLTDIINKFEMKNNTPDALRKWLKLKIDELIDVLNGNPPTSMYNEETLQILFEKSYYNQKGVPDKIY